MFLVDNILTSPMHGLLTIFREIHKAAQQEQESEGERIRTQLAELYLQLESGGITEDEFDASERELLDRLDALESGGSVEEEQEEEAALLYERE